MSEGTPDPAGPVAIEGAPEGERAMQIALVDDDRNILTTVAIALQAEGFATRLYSDGETALKALLDNPPDLAVFDIKMPKMDGMELLRRLRAKLRVAGRGFFLRDDTRACQPEVHAGPCEITVKRVARRISRQGR